VKPIYRVDRIDIKHIDCASLPTLQLICTLVNLGLLATAKPVRPLAGSAVGKPIRKPNIDFYDPFSLYVSDLYGVDPHAL